MDWLAYSLFLAFDLIIGCLAAVPLDFVFQAARHLVMVNLGRTDLGDWERERAGFILSLGLIGLVPLLLVLLFVHLRSRRWVDAPTRPSKTMIAVMVLLPYVAVRILGAVGF